MGYSGTVSTGLTSKSSTIPVAVKADLHHTTHRNKPHKIDLLTFQHEFRFHTSIKHAQTPSFDYSPFALLNEVKAHHPCTPTSTLYSM